MQYWSLKLLICFFKDKNHVWTISLYSSQKPILFSMKIKVLSTFTHIWSFWPTIPKTGKSNFNNTSPLTQYHIFCLLFHSSLLANACGVAWKQRFYSILLVFDHFGRLYPECETLNFDITPFLTKYHMIFLFYSFLVKKWHGLA